MMVDSVQRAEHLQMLALQQIHAQFQTDKPKDLYTMTLEDFMAEREAAEVNGEVEQFNARIRAYIEALLPQVLQPQTQEVQ